MWQCLADLCNSLARVYDGEAPLYKADADGEGDEELRVLQLEEDKMLAGFVPLLAAPQDPCYIDKGADTVIQAQNTQNVYKWICCITLMLRFRL